MPAFGLKGSGSRENTLKQYPRLYKAHSCPAENKPVQAIPQFNGVLNAPAKHNAAFFNAQRYAGMAKGRRHCQSIGAVKSRSRRSLFLCFKGNGVA